MLTVDPGGMVCPIAQTCRRHFDIPLHVEAHGPAVWAPLSQPNRVGEGKAGHTKPPKTAAHPATQAQNGPAPEPPGRTAATAPGPPPETGGGGWRDEGGRALGEGAKCRGRCRTSAVGSPGPVEFDR
jgi:hypothetical protein